MTDTASTASALSEHRRPFPQDSGWWEAEASRAPRASGRGRGGGNNSMELDRCGAVRRVRRIPLK